MSPELRHYLDRLERDRLLAAWLVHYRQILKEAQNGTQQLP